MTEHPPTQASTQAPASGTLTPRARAAHWKGRVVLVVSPTPTHPQDYGNRKRIYRICRMLQDAGAKIHFLHYASEAEWRQKLPLGAQTAMMRQWDGYYLVPPTRELHSPPQGAHHGIDEWWDPQVGTVLGWLTEKIRPDAVIVNYTWLSRALDFVPEGTLRILDTHDKFSGRKELLAGYDIAPEFFYTTESEEKIALDRADIVWAIKEEERLLFSEMTDRPVVTVPHADPTALMAPRPAPEDPADFELRIGVMGARNSVNTQNLTRFLEAAAPVFQTHLPPLKIVVGGTVCDLLEHINLPFVEKIGWVDDVEDFYRQIDVALIPMEFSTGLKIKTSEAMTYGLPILSHAHAFEGYRPFHAYSQLSSFHAMAEACVDLAFKGPDALEPLRLATANSHRAVVRELEAGVAATGAAIAGAQAYTLACLDPSVTRRGSLQEALARSNLEYLGHRSPLAMYFDAIGSVSDLLRFCRGTASSQIYVNDTLREGLSPSDLAQAEEAGVRWYGFEDLLSQIRVRHLWLDHIPAEPLRHTSPEFDRVYLNLGALHRGQIEDRLASGQLNQLIGPFTVVNVLGDSDSRFCSSVRKQLNAEMISMLPFWGKKFPLMWDMAPLPPEDRFGVTVILEEPSDAILKTVCDVARLAGQPLVNVVTLNSDDTEIRRVYRRGLDLRHLSPGTLTKTTLPLLRSVRTTVNFSTGSLFGKMLTSVMEAAGQDVMQVGRFENSPGAQVRQTTLLGFMRALHARLDDPGAESEAGTRFSALFDFDPGWGLIWSHYDR